MIISVPEAGISSGANLSPLFHSRIVTGRTQMLLWAVCFHARTQKTPKRTKGGVSAVVAHRLESMKVAPGKAKYPKLSAFDISWRCLVKDRRTRHVSALCPWTAFVGSPGLCCLHGEALPGEVQLSGGCSLAPRFPPRTTFPRDLAASLKPGSCSYGNPRRSKASITAKRPRLFWHSSVSSAGYLNAGG